MKGTFFNKPLEWNIETDGEAWTQGSQVSGHLKVRNHGDEKILLTDSGVSLSHAEIKKVHSKTEGAIKVEIKKDFENKELLPFEILELNFTLQLPENCPVSDKKSSYYLSYGRNFIESHLQLKVEPKVLYTKIIGLIDTFYRFKLKEYKSSKIGVEYKLIPPTSREMANLESLALSFSMEDEKLLMLYDFQIRKLDTASVTTKVNKASTKIERILTPKEYSFGGDMINQDSILKSVESVLNEIKLKNVF